MEQNHDMDEIDLLELARLLWSHALQIAAAGIAAAVICLLVCTFVLTPRYQASVNLIVNSRQDGNASITSDNINSARNLIDTYAVIIKSNIVLNDVIEQLGLDMTYRQLLACGILVLDHLLHDYIVDSEDIQKKLELPVLGLIPEV